MMVSIVFRVAFEIREKLRELAKANKRSMTQQVCWLIDKAYEEYNGNK